MMNGQQQFGSAYGAPGGMDLRKPYEVTGLPGMFKRTVYEVVYTEITLRNGNKKMRAKMVPKQVLEAAGYLVKFPSGHSIRVSSQEELRRLGFDAEPGLVDMLSGEVFQPNMRHAAGQVELLSLLSPDYISGDDQMRSKVGASSINLGESLEAAPKAKRRSPTKPKAKGGK
jgi:hypothetical protein